MFAPPLNSKFLCLCAVRLHATNIWTSTVCTLHVYTYYAGPGYRTCNYEIRVPSYLRSTIICNFSKKTPEVQGIGCRIFHFFLDVCHRCVVCCVGQCCLKIEVVFVCSSVEVRPVKFRLVVSTVVRSLLSTGSQKRVLNFQFPLFCPEVEAWK